MLSLEADLELVSGNHSIRIDATKGRDIRISFNRWEALSSVLSQPQLKGKISIKQALGYTRALDQALSLEVSKKKVVTIQGGKLKSFGFLALLRLLYHYIFR